MAWFGLWDGRVFDSGDSERVWEDDIEEEAGVRVPIRVGRITAFRLLFLGGGR